MIALNFIPWKNFPIKRSIYGLSFCLLPCRESLISAIRDQLWAQCRPTKYYCSVPLKDSWCYGDSSCQRISLISQVVWPQLHLVSSCKASLLVCLPLWGWALALASARGAISCWSGLGSLVANLFASLGKSSRPGWMIPGSVRLHWIGTITHEKRAPLSAHYLRPPWPSLSGSLRKRSVLLPSLETGTPYLYSNAPFALEDPARERPQLHCGWGCLAAGVTLPRVLPQPLRPSSQGLAVVLHQFTAWSCATRRTVWACFIASSNPTHCIGRCQSFWKNYENLD